MQKYKNTKKYINSNKIVKRVHSKETSFWNSLLCYAFCLSVVCLHRKYSQICCPEGPENSIF